MTQTHKDVNKNGNNQERKATQGDSATYPLMDHATDLTTASGRPIQSVNLEAAAAGEVDAADLQISASTLRAQAAVAEQAGYRELAQNLQRAAELTAVPNEELLRMYEVMRPGRSTYTELAQMADRLEHEYSAPITANFVREAAEVYRSRNLVRRG
jgi:propanediol dehydratase small subunit